MAILTVSEFDPNYKSHFDNHEIHGYSVYSGSEKIGSIDDLLVDENGNFRYLVLNTGTWGSGKKVLLPIGKARFDYKAHKVYVDGFNVQQVQSLPEYSRSQAINYEQEEQIRGVYRPTTAKQTQNTYTRDSYKYDANDPDLYNLNERDHQDLKLYEERLIADKRRQKAGEVAVGKRVETETARVDVPLQKERVVIERNEPSNPTAAAVNDPNAFNSGEVARVEVYAEVADIHKEAFVREEVKVKKVVEQENATAEEVLRREELDINRNDQPVTKTTDTTTNRRVDRNI